MPKKKKTKKTTIIISLFMAALFLMSIVAVLIPPGRRPPQAAGYETRTIYSYAFECDPNRSYYTEFRLSVDPTHPSKVLFKVSAERADANLTWYLMDIDAATFRDEVERGEGFRHVVAYEHAFSNHAEGEVSIETPGTYLFVFVQTNQKAGPQSVALDLKAEEWKNYET
ncbi:MAG: hypothetical protein ACE5GD_10710 [Candidatus Geothermarchaeales archaeon]